MNGVQSLDDTVLMIALNTFENTFKPAMVVVTASFSLFLASPFVTSHSTEFYYFNPVGLIIPTIKV